MLCVGGGQVVLAAKNTLLVKRGVIEINKGKTCRTGSGGGKHAMGGCLSQVTD